MHDLLTRLADEESLTRFIDANGLTFQSNGDFLPIDRQPDEVRQAMRDLEDLIGSPYPRTHYE